MLVRVVAAALMFWAVVDLALYWVVCSHNNQSMAIGTIIVKSLPFIAGVIVLIKARALAEWISDYLDN